MDIKEVIKRKETLQDAISVLIERFENDTGVDILYIDIELQPQQLVRCPSSDDMQTLITCNVFDCRKIKTKVVLDV